MVILRPCNIALKQNKTIMATILQNFTGKPMARPITTASQTERYTTEKQPMRPGSEDHEQVPSRRVATREWRDGRTEAA